MHSDSAVVISWPMNWKAHVFFDVHRLAMGARTWMNFMPDGDDDKLGIFVVNGTNSNLLAKTGEKAYNFLVFVHYCGYLLCVKYLVLID